VTRMDEYHTYTGYEKMQTGLSQSMEDYLEMISRLSLEEPAVRMHRLAAALHIADSSATRMAKQLADLGDIRYKPYDFIRLTAKGEEKGNYLLYRHNVIVDFLRALNGEEGDLREAELIEHHLQEKTVENLRSLTEKMLRRD